MNQWLSDNFPSQDNGNIGVGTINGVVVSIVASNITALFGAISTPPTYAELSALPVATAGGWQPIFDQWKAQGLIS